MVRMLAANCQAKSVPYFTECIMLYVTPPPLGFQKLDCFEERRRTRGGWGAVCNTLVTPKFFYEFYVVRKISLRSLCDERYDIVFLHVFRFFREACVEVAPSTSILGYILLSLRKPGVDKSILGKIVGRWFESEIGALGATLRILSTKLTRRKYSKNPEGSSPALQNRRIMTILIREIQRDFPKNTTFPSIISHWKKAISWLHTRKHLIKNYLCAIHVWHSIDSDPSDH